jgi:hypothetical protein
VQPRGSVEARGEAKAGPIVSESLPELLDAKALQAELGVTRAAAEAIMRRLPVVQPDCLRKVYVRRGDVAAYIDASTSAPAERGSTLRERCRGTVPVKDTAPR